MILPIFYLGKYTNTVDKQNNNLDIG